MDYCIFPPEEMPEGIIDLPLSKSISNRVLILNALTGNRGRIERTAECDDTTVMFTALSQTSDEVNIGAAGTAMRFLTAYFAMQPGRTVTINGTERMCNRPIALLVDALRQCGASIEYVDKEGYPPLKIHGCRLTGGDITLPASVSSQYVSALLMTAPLMEHGLKLTLTDGIVSLPYIKMTLGLMKEWGVDSDFTDNVITVEPQHYTPVDFKVEADWSAASYWYEIEALSSGDLSLRGLSRNSLQGDSHVADFFTGLGVNSEWDDDVMELMPSPDLTPRITLDMSEQPDLAQTVVVTCAMLGLPFHITGLSTLKIKETDRLTALRDELRKLSFVIDIVDDNALEWEGARCPVDTSRPVVIDTYQDHRMAMAFAPVALYIPGLIIRNADVVTKSYPEYWDHLRSIGFTTKEVDADTLLNNI